MKDYQARYIEILGLHTKSSSFYMEVRIHQEAEDFVRSVKIDDEMYANLGKLLPSVPDKRRFRLSRQFNRLQDSGQWMGALSVTQLDTSQKIPFPCTESFVKQVYLIHETPKKPTFSPSSIRDSLMTESSRKKRAGILKKTGFFLMAFVVLISFANMSVDTIAKSGSFESQTEETVYEPAYGSQDFPEVKDNQEEFFSTTYGHVEEETATERIRDLVEIALPDGNAPYVTLENTWTRSISSNMVALTFDDGPSDYTREIADILYEYQVGGTFFFVGENIPENGYLVRYVNQLGFSIGNHSYAHPYFISLSREKQAQEIEDTNQLIANLTEEQIILFRPPYGAMNQTTYNLVEDKGMKIVLWNKDTEDWKAKNSQELLSYAKENITGGSIVLFHEKKITVEALPSIIEYLQEQGLEIVNLR